MEQAANSLRQALQFAIEALDERQQDVVRAHPELADRLKLCRLGMTQAVDGLTEATR
jgi:2-oxo-4-hydroxy-4-carboxy--5-ureidoimidazoline (OHCU) decarboxylase